MSVPIGRPGDGAWERVKCVRFVRWEKMRERTGRDCRGSETKESDFRLLLLSNAA
jgi:hypothetical protein